MFVLFTLLSSVLGVKCLPAAWIQNEKIAVQAEFQAAIKSLDVDVQALKLFNITVEPIILTDLKKGLHDFEFDITRALDEFEKVACARCADHVKLFETFVDMLENVMAVVDKEWQKNPLFIGIMKFFSALEVLGEHACPEPTTTLAPKTVDSDRDDMCLAGEDVQSVLNALDDVLTGAKNGLKEAENIRLVGGAAKMAFGAVSIAENVLNFEAPRIEMAVCAGCRDLEKMFDLVKAEIERVVGKLGHPAIEKTVEGIMNAIDSAFMMACPLKPSTPKPSTPKPSTPKPSALEAQLSECLLQEQVTTMFNMAQFALSWAEKEITENAKFFAEYQKMFLNIIKGVQSDLTAEAPKIEAMSCAICPIVESEISAAKSKILAFLGSIGNKKLTEWAGKLLAMLDAVVAKECAPAQTPKASTVAPSLVAVPALPNAPSQKCVAQTAVTEIFGTAELGMDFALKMVKKLENNNGTIGVMATMAYSVLTAQDARLKTEAATFEAKACASCDLMKGLFADAAAKIEAAVAKMNKPMISATITGLLSKALNVMGKHCAPSTPATTASPGTATTVPPAFLEAETDEECVAGEVVTKTLNKLDMYLNDAATEVSRMTTKNSKFAPEAKMLLTGIEAAANVVSKLTPEIADGVCKACTKLEGFFDVVSKEVLKVIDGLNNPDVKAAAQKIVSGISVGFDMACAAPKAKPTTTTAAAPAELEAEIYTTVAPIYNPWPTAAEIEAATTAAPTTCALGTDVAKVLGTLKTYMSEAIPVVEKFATKFPVANKVAAGIEKAEMMISAALPFVAAEVCANCGKLETYFSAVAAQVTKVLDGLKNPDLEAAGQKMITTINNGLQAVCPSASVFER